MAGGEFGDQVELLDPAGPLRRVWSRPVVVPFDQPVFGHALHAAVHPELLERFFEVVDFHPRAAAERLGLLRQVVERPRQCAEHLRVWVIAL